MQIQMLLTKFTPGAVRYDEINPLTDSTYPTYASQGNKVGYLYIRQSASRELLELTKAAGPGEEGTINGYPRIITVTIEPHR